MQKGKLKIRKVKKGMEYLAVFENAKGKIVEMAIQPGQRFFDVDKVNDGDPLEFELLNGQPSQCVVPGKEAKPIIKNPTPKAQSHPGGNNWQNSGKGGNAWQSGGRGGNTRALRDAVAPYNFVSFTEKAVIPAFEDEEGLWSGQLVVSLEALTPLLVCGQQEKASASSPAIHRFMRAGDRNVIPGSSLKGMLRSLLSILSFSRLHPISHEQLFWRRVDRPEYRGFFADGKVLGGYLRKKGAEYSLTPVHVTRSKEMPHGGDNSELVKTGGMKNDKTGAYSTDYYFHKPAPDAATLKIDPSLVNTLWSQLTPNQEKRWDAKMRQERLGCYPGLPVFYRVNSENEVCELGFCRYFRLKYKYSPYDLAYPDKDEIGVDFTQRLFGYIGEESVKGRVAVSPAFMEGKLYSESGLEAVLGAPRPTCLPLYICQGEQVTTISHGTKNNLDSMASYNDNYARIRGHKLYWHHNVDEKFFPGREIMSKKDDTKNYKVISRLFPLAAGANARFVIHIDRLSSTELGGLLEAIELPKGQAHKLGMGKSLGLGSVRLKIEEARIFNIRKAHASLLERLDQPSPSLSQEKLAELRQHFRSRVLEAVRKQHGEWKNCANYEDLPPIKELRIMMDYANRPSPAAVRTMTLRYINGDELTRINFGLNAILPYPAQVKKQV